MPNPDTAAQVQRLREMAENARAAASLGRLHGLNDTADYKDGRAALFSAAADALEREAGLVADAERLTWLERNPRLVVASTGYLGADNCWCWRDASNSLATHEASSLREAIDAARGGGK